MLRIDVFAISPRCLAGLFVLAPALFVAASANAQEDQAKSMVAECIKVQREKFEPLKEQSQQLYRKFGSQTSAIYEVIRWLEQDPESAETKRLQEIEQAEARLAALKELGNMTSEQATASDAVAKTIEQAHVKIEDINDQRSDAAKPFERERSSLIREYRDREDALEPTMEGLFAESGSGDLVGDLKRSYASFSYSTAEASAQYKRGDKNQIVCSVRVYLSSPRKVTKDLGKLNDKYPIVSQTNNQLEVLVGDALVNVYSSDSKLTKDNLGPAMMALFDFEKLESLLK